MNILSFLSFLILVITLLTMVFGVIAYFLYKARERKKIDTEVTYDEALQQENRRYLFFDERE